MGKGDRRTKKGKIVQGSFGVSRLHKPNKGENATPENEPKKSTSKTKAKIKKD